MGTATAETIRWPQYALGQVMVTAIQLTAHYVNEYADVESDRAVINRTWFSGGSGVLAQGTLDPRLALRAALITSAVGLATSLRLAFVSPWLLAIGTVALVVAWIYSIPPVRLLGTGWGELATSVVVAGFVPMVGSITQGSRLDSRLWWAIAILLPIHLAMVLAFELPDLDSDKGAGKRVLAVRLGRRKAETAISAFYGLALLIGILPWSRATLDTRWLAFAVLPAAVAVVAASGHRFHLLTTSAVAVLVVSSVTLWWVIVG